MTSSLRTIIIALIFALIALALYATLYVLDAAPADQLWDIFSKTLLVITISLAAVLALISLVKLANK